jgi:hypothetical protein
MWVFTETGFVSAVVENPNKSKTRLSVRSRDKKSLEPLAKMAKTQIIELPNRDYEYRVYVEKNVFNNWVSGSISKMEYGNYKTRMYSTRGGEFTHSLSNVWSAMLNVSDKRVKVTNKGIGSYKDWQLDADLYDEDHI